jgi:hypothetical protein
VYLFDSRGRRIAQPFQRLDLGLVIGTTGGQRDTPSRQEALGTCLPEPAIDVLLAVDDRVKRNEGGSLGSGSTLHVIVEESLPGSGAEFGRTRDHSVEVKREASSLLRMVCSGDMITPAHEK